MPLTAKMKKRIVFGALMIVLLVGLILFEAWLSLRNYFLPETFTGAGLAVAAVLILLAVGGIRELSRMAVNRNLRTANATAIILATLVILQPYYSQLWPGTAWTFLASPTVVLFACLFIAAFFHALAFGTVDTISTLSTTSLQVLYLALGCWFLLQVRMVGAWRESIWLQSMPILLFLATVKSCDIGAYFIGSAWGRRRLAPAISPNKTWEGTLGGVAVSIVVASLFAAFSDIITLGTGVLFGAVVAIAGQLGDLFESLLKRDAAVKDSAELLPEFGGVLDLLDSPLAAAPVAFVVLRAAGV